MKFISICLIVIGIIIIFNAGGITTPVGGFVIGLLNGGLISFQSLTIWTKFSAVLTTVAVAGVVIGTFVRTPPESYLIAPLLTTVGGLMIIDLLTVYMVLWSLNETWIQWVASGLFIPLVFMFVMSLVSYWRGADG